jgi:hypothetical protein
MFWLDDFELVVLYSSLADIELQLGVFWEREIANGWMKTQDYLDDGLMV